eukprot:Gregarina_sp_Pseudo_9__886@NODE_1566_length_1490_cov_4_534804_g1453_i0_p1_GENE_NODE_1566_length_1490_cov_4_534804_g1453_i0NODE_1566_length_1490_cov_4_534804_g1453_i0_p1_ORF_typecomplete_len412_score117_79IIGP/PF05049_13/7_9e34IIGP/PF05049_13/68MMR_HSR1/PF01926_23/3_3e06MMR_HSR1/PF01926_23/3_8e03FeoB_N/PF02421_18/4_8e05Roc/PF08477_13/0_00028RsgA_GTPase/PF03193_16/0_0068RsgA_GTPase/PF03193_16/3_8e03DUF3450/PF11932_8/0_0052AAA_22/PF13401_6/5_3e03AAA_22/PF13401_6/0_022Dynamin_N/PF00350_23/0_21Dynami
MSDRRERERHQASSSSAPQETPYLSRGRVCGLLWQLSQPAPFLVFLEVIERIYAWCLSSPAGGSFRRELFGVRPGAVYCDLEAQRAELLDDVNDFVERAKADAFRAEFEAESARIEVLMREHARLEAQIAEYQRRLTAQETRREETAETPVSAADLAAARSKLGAGFFHVALVGDAGCGKSALCNALRGVRNNAPDAAYVGACVGTTCAGVYPGPPHTQILFHDLPGAGTPEQSRTAYFRAHSLYAFDLLIVVWHGAVSDSTVRILRNAHPTQHVLLVRSKADLHLSNMLQDAEDALLDDDGTALATNPGAAAHTHTAPHETSSPHTAPHETASPHTAPQETSSPHTAPHETSSPHTLFTHTVFTHRECPHTHTTNVHTHDYKRDDGLCICNSNGTMLLLYCDTDGVKLRL